MWIYSCIHKCTCSVWLNHRSRMTSQIPTSCFNTFAGYCWWCEWWVIRGRDKETPQVQQKSQIHVVIYIYICKVPSCPNWEKAFISVEIPMRGRLFIFGRFPFVEFRFPPSTPWSMSLPQAFVSFIQKAGPWIWGTCIFGCCQCSSILGSPQAPRSQCSSHRGFFFFGKKHALEVWNMHLVGFVNFH